MNTCIGYKVPMHGTSDDVDPDQLCGDCRHHLAVDCRHPTRIISGVRTDELETGDAVVWSSGEVYHFTGTQPITGSDYVHVGWLDGRYAFDTTAEPHNTWTVVRSV